MQFYNYLLNRIHHTLKEKGETSFPILLHIYDAYVYCYMYVYIADVCFYDTVNLWTFEKAATRCHIQTFCPWMCCMNLNSININLYTWRQFCPFGLKLWPFDLSKQSGSED